MRRAILALVLGVVSLQQMADLPNQALCRYVVVAIVLCVIFAWLSVRQLRARQLTQTTSVQSSIKVGRLLYMGFSLLACFLAGFCWSAYRAQLHMAQELPRQFEQVELQLEGIIRSLPSGDEHAQHFQFQLLRLPTELARTWPEGVDINLAWYGSAACGFDLNRLRAGQRWRLPVRLRRPHGVQNPGGFDYELWLFEQNLRASAYVSASSNSAHCAKFSLLEGRATGLYDELQNWRGSLRDKIRQLLPDSEYAPVLVALVIGEQRGIPQAQWQLFNRSGIGHLISISGLHITMLASLAATLAGACWRSAARRRQRFCLWLPRLYLESVVGVIIALAYTALAGFGIPAQRTLIMLFVCAIARMHGRNLTASRALMLALGIVVIYDPWSVLSPGFWLSFVAVGLLMYGSRHAKEHATNRIGQLFSRIHEAARAQYVITVGMLPLGLLLFSEISLISPLANALAIPLISLLVTPLALLGALMPTPIATWFLQLANALMGALMSVLDKLVQLPVVTWVAPAPDWLSMLLACIGVVYLLAPRGLPARYLGLVCCLPIVFSVVQTPASGQFRAQFIDVGQGMAVLVETANHRLLYDSGPAYLGAQDAGARIVLPYLRQRGISSLTMLMISHNDSDHSGGMASVLKQIQVEQLVSSLTPMQLQSKLSGLTPGRHWPPPQPCQYGQSWRWDGVDFLVMHPDSETLTSPTVKANAKSCVLRISNGRSSLLLAGDIEAPQEQALLMRFTPAQLRSTVLLAPHHGSGTSSTPAFVAAVQPQIAVFQMAYQNRYRHPKSSVWQRYADFGITRLRSDAQGAIQIDFASSLSVFSQRQHRKRYWFSDVSWLNPDVQTPDGAEFDTGRLFTSAYE